MYCLFFNCGSLTITTPVHTRLTAHSNLPSDECCGLVTLLHNNTVSLLHNNTVNLTHAYFAHNTDTLYIIYNNKKLTTHIYPRQANNCCGPWGWCQQETRGPAVSHSKHMCLDFGYQNTQRFFHILNCLNPVSVSVITAWFLRSCFAIKRPVTEPLQLEPWIERLVTSWRLLVGGKNSKAALWWLARMGGVGRYRGREAHWDKQ